MKMRLRFFAALISAFAILTSSAFAQSNNNRSSTNNSSTGEAVSNPVSQAVTVNTIGAISGGSTRGMGGGQSTFGSAAAAYTSGNTGFTSASGRGETGASAGSSAQRFGVWGNFSGTEFSESQSAIDSDGQVYTFAVGADYLVSNWMIAGLSLGYERQSVNTNFNRGTWDSNGLVVAPYVVLQLIPNKLFLDATVGYVGQSINLERSNGSISADTTGTRFFMSSNLQANLEYGKFRVRPIVGAMWMYQGIEGYQETGTGAQNVQDTTVHFGRMIAGTQVAYTFGNVQPYVLAQYQYDYKSDVPTVGAGQIQPIVYRNSALVGAGVLFNISPRLSSGVQFGTEVGKADYISYTGQGTLRYVF